MPQQFANRLQFLVGNSDVLDAMENVAGDEPFSAETVAFLDDLGKVLRNDPEAKMFPDVQTFSFWCRKSSVLAMKRQYPDLENRAGRGLAFHIAPSNIPMMFMFSLAAALLAGNANIVRISQTGSRQANIMCRTLNDALPRYPHLRRRIVIVQYARDAEINTYFSRICDSRIIWGGDRSVNELRKFDLAPYAIDLPFYDRFSFAVVNSSEYIKCNEPRKKRLAEQFYNDTYLTDQNACTSPQLVLWTDKDNDTARQEFWGKLAALVRGRYKFQNIQGVDKLVAAARYAVWHGDGRKEQGDNYLWRAEISQLHTDLKDLRCPGGYFYEYRIKDLDEIAPLCSKSCQTIAYFGFERQAILDAVRRNNCRGVDRIVPIGSTMDFGLQWDGFDLIDSLTKVWA